MRLVTRWMRDMKLRNKLLLMVLPLVVVPLLLVGGVVGTFASREAFQGVEQASRNDLEHMSEFTLDLLNAHHQQFEIHREDKKRTVREELETLVNFAINLVEEEQRLHKEGWVTLEEAREDAADALKKVNVGETGYIYAMTSKGTLTAHIASQGENIYNAVDDEGRFFIREMCLEALRAPPGEVLHTVYPWKNAILGDEHPREKAVAYRYYPKWDWIIAAGGYLDETYEDEAYEKLAFAEIKERLSRKKVGTTGYIYALAGDGRAVIHPFREGELLIDETDDKGHPFIREMVERKSGWIRYPWKNEGEPAPRMKVVRYAHFEPWNWVVAVGSYEEEFLHDAQALRGRVNRTMLVLLLGVGLGAILLVFRLSRVFTDPVARMTEVIRRVRGGHLDETMEAERHDELGELGRAYNRMAEALKKHREMEARLAQQGKMASLGVLSSGVAHEINNPLGVILGYAAYLEKKLDPEDSNLKYIQEIKRESKRSKKIVQDLLSYARAPRPDFSPVDVNELLDQIIDFASNHADMHGVEVEKDFDPALPPVEADGDLLSQVAINLILNAGNAMGEGGRIRVATRLAAGGWVEIGFADEGCGISEDLREKIFEPFFTTRSRGTGLGLAITRQIIERHQGEIHVESTEGEGTTFTVSLPVEHEEF